MDDNWKMHGCGVGERCCFPLEDEVPEYKLGIDFDEFICSKDGNLSFKINDKSAVKTVICLLKSTNSSAEKTVIYLLKSMINLQ